MNSKEEKMAKGPIFKTMLTLGIPAFIAQLVNMLYNIVDRVFIGHIPGSGAAALTGVGICFPIVTLIAAFANLAGVGGAPLAGMALGSGDRKQAEKIIGTSASVLIILAVVLTVVFQVIKRPFLFLFGASDVTYSYGAPYLTIYLFGTIFVMLAAGLNAYISVQGAAMTAMASVLIGAVLNLILDPILIFAFDMGTRGAAIATVVSQAVSALWVVRYLIRPDTSIRLRKEYLIPNLKIVGRIFALGVSPFIMAATESLITVVFNRGAAHYGNDLYVGSITILQSVIAIILNPMNGFANGVQGLISYNYGAGNKERVRKTCYTLIVVNFSCCFILALLCMLFPTIVAGIFTNDAELVALVGKVGPLFIAGMLLFGLQSSSQTCFVALGCVKQSLFFALLRKVILLTPLALILPAAMNSVMGLYIAEPVSDALSAICCFTVFMMTMRKMNLDSPAKA